MRNERASELAVPNKRDSRLRHWTGKGLGMGEGSEEKPDSQTVASNQTMGQVITSTSSSAVPHGA